MLRRHTDHAALVSWFREDLKGKKKCFSFALRHILVVLEMH